MPRTPHPTLKSYEAFVEGMAKESDETKRYFYQQILWAEKERERHSLKSKRAREKAKKTLEELKELKEKVEAAAAADTKTKKVRTPDEDCESCRGTGRIYICDDVFANCACVGGIGCTAHLSHRSSLPRGRGMELVQKLTAPSGTVA
jgi:hypothetical protein